MLRLATDWSTVSSLVTGVGTLVLAIATFASVRSSNRSARIAEAALQEQRRPVFAPSRMDDPVQKLMFLDGVWLSASGGRAAVEHVDGRVYLAISLRNVGSGMGVCQGWAAWASFGSAQDLPTHAPVEQFRLQGRDMYIPPGDIGMWQGAARNPDDPLRAALAEKIEAREPFQVELLYSDQVGLQRTITRFGLVPAADSWLTSVSRHWYLDWDGPRPETDVLAASEAVRRDQQAAERVAAVGNGQASAGVHSSGADDGAAGVDGATGDDDGAADDGAAGDDGGLAAREARGAGSPRGEPPS